MKKIKAKIIDFAKKNLLIRGLVKKANFLVKRCKYMIAYLTNKIDDKSIIFECFNGRKYCDSPKAIYLKMLSSKDYKDYKFIWAFREPEKYDELNKNHNTIVVKSGSKKYLKAMASCKYWVINYRLSDVIKKKKNQIYLQCWHGTPLKRLGCDIEVEGNLLSTKKEIHKQYIGDSKRYNYMISPSAFATEKFMSSFGIKNKDIMIEEGYPRNDFIVNHTSKDVDNIKKRLNIPKNKKVILYAPTFRDNQHKSGLGYTYQINVNFDSWKKELEKDYIVLFRPHYLVANAFDFAKYEGFIYDVSDYDDVNDLYVISDLLITDYSSVFFDYAILKRPILFYMYDLDDYKNNLRDFYFDLKELPGPIVEKEKDLLKEIAKIKEFKYDKRYQDFNKKFNYLDDGNCALKVIKKVVK